MKHKLPVLISAIFLILLAGSFEQVLACSCVRATPCQSYESADIVFIGKAVGSKYQVERKVYGTSESEPKTVTYDIGEIYFEVTKAFKGTTDGLRLTIHSSKSGAACGYMFERDKSYVVFSSKSDNGRLSTGLCSGNRKISRAETTLDYLQNLPKNGSGGLIFGRIDESIKDYSAERLRSKPMPNVEIKAQQLDSNKSVFFGMTDANGQYEIKVPPGKYILTLLHQNLYYGDKKNNKSLSVLNKQCKSKDFYVINDSRIEGKVVDSEGNFAKNISLHLIPADLKRGDKNYDYEIAYVGDDGQFSFSGLPLGRYQISLNYSDKPENDSPYPTTFYPNARTREEALTLDIKYGTKIKDLFFQLPPKLKKRKITGTVFWENGKLANKAEVELLDIEFDDDIFTFNKIYTNSEGEFELEWFEGRKYKLKVMMWQKSADGSYSFGVANAETQIFTLNEKTKKFEIILKDINTREK